jgi:alginate export protein
MVPFVSDHTGGDLRRAPGILATVVALLVITPTAFAQADQQKKFLEEERRREMDERARANADLKQDFLWDAGGWLHGEFVRLDDKPDRDHRTFRYADLRLWGEAVFYQRYTAYLRLQTDYTDFNRGDQFAGKHDNVFRSPHVDQAYLAADFSDEETELSVRGGRQFESLGRGLLLNGVYYALHGSWSSGRFSARALLAHTPIHDDDIDPSLPNFRDSRRGFVGLEGNYVLSGDHRVYLMALVERDFNDESNTFQKWDYNATYIGVGGRGTVIEDLGYAAEAVVEFGTVPGAGSQKTDAIQAFALTLALDYAWRVDTSPTFVLEYMFATGDKDRGSVTEVAAGNRSGTKDTGFLAFGFVQTGFALFPRLSNLHILRVGGSFHPLESVEEARTLEFGAFFYLYRKVQSAEPISDPRSFVDDSDVGTEVDLLVRWRILSDLGISLNYGVFMPGGAYDETSNRNFFSAGLTYSF